MQTSSTAHSELLCTAFADQIRRLRTPGTPTSGRGSTPNTSRQRRQRPPSRSPAVKDHLYWHPEGGASTEATLTRGVPRAMVDLVWLKSHAKGGGGIASTRDSGGSLSSSSSSSSQNKARRRTPSSFFAQKAQHVKDAMADAAALKEGLRYGQHGHRTAYHTELWQALGAGLQGRRGNGDGHAMDEEEKGSDEGEGKKGGGLERREAWQLEPRLLQRPAAVQRLLERTELLRRRAELTIAAAAAAGATLGGRDGKDAVVPMSMNTSCWTAEALGVSGRRFRSSESEEEEEEEEEGRGGLRDEGVVIEDGFEDSEGQGVSQGGRRRRREGRLSQVEAAAMLERMGEEGDALIARAYALRIGVGEKEGEDKDEEEEEEEDEEKKEDEEEEEKGKTKEGGAAVAGRMTTEQAKIYFARAHYEMDGLLARAQAGREIHDHSLR